MIELLERHAATLAAGGVSSPRTDARLLAAHTLGLTPAEVRTRRTDRCDPAALARLDDLVARRARREPLQHLVGETGFRRITVRCRPGVLVPRPETEVLAGLAVDLATDAVDRTGPIVVLEPCTGSGVVALALASEVSGVTVHAGDIDPNAVSLARENLATVQPRPGSTVTIERGDLFATAPPAVAGGAAIVVSNPPYLTPAELAASPPEVAAHEPGHALVGGPDGLTVIRRLIDGAPRWLRPSGALLLEVAPARAATVAGLAASAGFADVDVVDDLAGRPRVVVGRWAAGR